MEVVEIEIVGRRYTLRSERPPEHIQAVADFVDERLREVSGGDAASVQRDHAILAALNIASELFLMRERHDDIANVAESMIDQLVDRIDQVIGTSEPRSPTG